jgi:hypothetical protein
MGDRARNHHFKVIIGISKKFKEKKKNQRKVKIKRK